MYRHNTMVFFEPYTKITSLNIHCNYVVDNSVSTSTMREHYLFERLSFVTGSVLLLIATILQNLGNTRHAMIHDEQLSI